MQFNRDEYVLLSRRGSVPPAQGRRPRGPAPHLDVGEAGGRARSARRRRRFADLVPAPLRPRRNPVLPGRREGFRDH